MSVVKSLYELQELDEALAADERRLAQIRAELADDREVVTARTRLDTELTVQAGLQKVQHDLEWVIEDLTGKIDKAQEELYSGRIRNPKELSNLEQEVATLKTNRSGREDEAIELMEQLESAGSRIAELKAALATLEATWQARQADLLKEQVTLEAAVADLGQQRTALLGQIDPEALRCYRELRGQKGMAVARVDQGICLGCRLSLSNAELQRVRGGDLTQCTSCGRILFLR